jgi:hypothetical protein
MPGNNRTEAPAPLSQTQEFGMVPVYEERRGGRGPLLGYKFDKSFAASQGIIDVPKPPAILAEEQRLGGKQLEPIYAEETVGRGNRKVSYGPPIGYRYDNGQSQYVNFDASGQYQGTQDRSNSLLPLLGILAMPFVGPALFEALGLGGAAAGTGLLAGEGAVSALPLSQLATGEAGLGVLGMEGAAGTGLTALPSLSSIAGAPLTEAGLGALGMEGAVGTGLTALPSLSPLAGAPLAAAGTGLASMNGGTGLSALGAGGETIGAGSELTLPSWVTPTNALLAASTLSGIANANKDEPTAPTFTMPAYVPPSGKPFANLGMSPIATPYTPTRIAGQYDPTMTPGGVSPYEMLMQQMQAPKNLYADFEAGTAMGGFNPKKFVTPQNSASAAAALSNNMGGTTMYGSALPNYMPGIEAANIGTGLPNGIELMNAINSGKISKGNLSGLLQA